MNRDMMSRSQGILSEEKRKNDQPESAGAVPAFREEDGVRFTGHPRRGGRGEDQTGRSGADLAALPQLCAVLGLIFI